MTDTNARPYDMRPLETELDFSPLTVPLRWAEEGMIVRLHNSRIALEDIVTYYRMGYTAEMIGDTYPWLKLSDIYLVIAFYLRNEQDVHAYLRESDKRADEIGERLVESGITPKENYEAYLAERPKHRFYDEK